MATRAYFSVENYRGSTVAQRRETRDIDEACRWANETPDSAVAIQDGKGWVKGWAVFSAKHPPSVAAIRAKVKTHFKRTAKKNPRTRTVSKQAGAVKRATVSKKRAAPPKWCIYARRTAKSPVMHYTGERFSDNGKPREYASSDTAMTAARALLDAHAVLRGFKVTVERKRKRNP